MVVTPKEFSALKKQVKKQEDIIQVLKSVDCTISAPLQKKLKVLEALLWPVQRTYSMRRSGGSQRYLYMLRNKKENKSYQFRQIYDESDQIYGAKKISVVLKSRGVAVSDKIVDEFMQEMNLAGIRTGGKL